MNFSIIKIITLDGLLTKAGIFIKMRLKEVNLTRFIIILFCTVINTSYISSTCNDGQIDINSASVEELDGLVGVGPVIAQNIIDSRPYQTLDDLVNANGIGEARLANIKSQNLACVKEDNLEEDTNKESVSQDNKKEKNDEKTNDGDNQEESGIKDKLVEEANIQDKSFNEEIKPLEPIQLTAQSIKTEEIKDNYKNKLAIYGFIGFCILIVVLFLLRKERFKNEFR